MFRPPEGLEGIRAEPTVRPRVGDKAHNRAEVGTRVDDSHNRGETTKAASKEWEEANLRDSNGHLTHAPKWAEEVTDQEVHGMAKATGYHTITR